MRVESGRLRSVDDPGALRQAVQDGKRLLLDAARSFAPDCIVFDQHPFAKVDFHDLYLSLVEEARRLNPQTRVVCSVRDIVRPSREFEPHKLRQHEAFKVDVLNSHYDLILCHSDPAVVQLSDWFSLHERLEVEVCHTGYVLDRGP